MTRSPLSPFNRLRNPLSPLNRRRSLTDSETESPQTGSKRRKKVMSGHGTSHPISSIGSINMNAELLVEVDDDVFVEGGTRTTEASPLIVVGRPIQEREKTSKKRVPSMPMEERESPSKKRKGTKNPRSSNIIVDNVVQDGTRSLIWSHFNKIYCKDTKKIEKGRCQYCSKEIKADTKSIGTKPLWNHFNTCKKVKDHLDMTGQQNLNALAQRPAEKGGTSTWIFDQVRAERALCKYILIDELPLCMVEKPGIHILVEEIQPLFILPSRRKLTIRCYEMYVEEKRRLMSYIRGYSQRVSLTTDTWSSQQKITYMALTVHFIDDNWKLQKRILNFCPVEGHKGVDLGSAVEECLNEWGIEKVFTVTVDNASANNGVVYALKRKFCERNSSSILQGKYMHMRCVAHIVNLIVRDGLKGPEEDFVISHIRAAVYYVRNSPTRYKKFCDRAKREKLNSKRMLCYDVKTRWNSTYLMLRAAVAHRKAFEAYEMEDRYYKTDLGDDIPTESDWERAKFLMKYLEPFYKLTLRISGAKYVTSNLVFHELYHVDQFLKKWKNGDDEELRNMAIKMKLKYDKYWGPVNNMNKLLYYAVILDPRRKWECIEWRFERMYPKNDVINDDDFVGDGDDFFDSPTDVSFLEQVRNGFNELFVEYKRLYGKETTPKVPSPYAGASRGASDDDDSSNEEEDDYVKARKREKGKKEVKTELDRYLSEDCEENEHLDVLEWWGKESHRFPVLSRMARDILAVPVSTVASEATFSTSGRILDDFRSSLTPRMAQAIICAQDWMRPNGTQIKVEEDMDQLESLEKEFTPDETTISDA